MLGATRHLVDLLRLAVIASGPLPFGLVVARATPRPARFWAHAALAVLTVWCVVPVSVGLSHGIFGYNALTPALLAEALPVS